MYAVVAPTYTISYAASLPNGDLFSGEEVVTGNTVGLRGTLIRAYGFLNFNDNAGNIGKLTLDRENRIVLKVKDNPMDLKLT